MTTVATSPHSMVLADLVPGALRRDVAVVAGGAALVGLAAQVSISTPLSPVPFTLQTLAVLLVGAASGPRRAAGALALYMLAGLAGVPCFAHHTSGWSGASFGYVVGFLAAAVVVGELARRGNDRSMLSTIGLLVIGNAVIYTFGTAWLAVDLGLSASKAIELGVVPFVIGDIIKVAVVAAVLPAAWRLTRRG